ncbi:MAG: hypothetical protein K8T10_10500 [Candidatus Eremiobacteraeota bacterium]|nr:hypothetical protein [Candidatus Eremiobacteraeota bacterium]
MTLGDKIRVEKTWKTVLETYVEKGGVMFVLGGVDTGKSTFVRWIANELLYRGVKPAIVDCDVGQSDIGPPTTIGMAVIKKHFSGYDEISADGIYFTGDVKPEGRLLQGLTGTIKMVEKAKTESCSHIILNTTGWIHGAAIFYKHCKIDAFSPGMLVAFQKEKELYPITSPYRKMTSINSFFIVPTSAARQRDRDERRKNRSEHFFRYFKNAPLLAIPAKKMGISGTYFPIDGERVQDLLVALIDNSGEHRAIGIVKAYNTKIKMLEIKTPFDDKPNKIRRIHFEHFRYIEENVRDSPGESEIGC